MDTLGHPTFVVALRLKNIAAFSLGKMDAWGLINQSMTEDPWDYAHITTFNFLPFVMRKNRRSPALGHRCDHRSLVRNGSGSVLPADLHRKPGPPRQTCRA